MRHVGTGRITLWEGASLWAFDVPPNATARRSTDLHAHHAIQFTFAIDGSFAFQIAGQDVPGPAVLIAPDVPHAYTPQGRNAIVFVEPESRAGAAILRGLSGQHFSRPDPTLFAEHTGRLHCIWRLPRPDDGYIASAGREVVAQLAGAAAPMQTIDRRITRVLDHLSSTLGAGLDVGEAAGIACLSESRFSHVFVEQIGLPFRTYLLWRRLTLAVNSIAAGASLTEAAHDAGFSDSAHFSRTFLRMFGVPASLLLLI